MTISECQDKLPVMVEDTHPTNCPRICSCVSVCLFVVRLSAGHFFYCMFRYELVSYALLDTWTDSLLFFFIT